MFAGPSVSREREARDTLPAAPKVDADPGNRRLFVRGTSEQIAQVKQLVSGYSPISLEIKLRRTPFECCP